jgi:hypothetical protein
MPFFPSIVSPGNEELCRSKRQGEVLEEHLGRSKYNISMRAGRGNAQQWREVREDCFYAL